MTWEIKKCFSHLIINNINKHDASALECRIASSSFARNKLSSHFDTVSGTTLCHESNDLKEFISQRYLKKGKMTCTRTIVLYPTTRCGKMSEN